MRNSYLLLGTSLIAETLSESLERKSMYLSNNELEEIVEEMNIETSIKDHEFSSKEQIRLCSIDLRMSNVIWYQKKLRWGKKIDLKHGKLYEISPTRLWNKKYYELNEKIILKPGEMILGQTYEKFTIPSRFAGKIITRSSYTRLGIETSCTNDFINPGYRGRVPLEIINNSKNTIVLYPLLPICQIMILPLTSVPAGTYGDERFSSKYQNEEGSPSLWWRDNLMNKIENELTALDFDTKMIELYSVKLNSVDDDCIDRFHKFIVNVKSKNMTTSENVFNKFLKQELYKNNFRKVLKGLLIVISAFFANVFYAEISKEVSSLDILLESGAITFVTLICWIKVLLDRKQYLMEE